MSTSSAVAAALEQLARSLTTNFASSVATQSEDQLKAPVKGSLEAASPRRVVARSGAQVAGLGGRPTLALSV
jgi:hypothetical protein